MAVINAKNREQIRVAVGDRLGAVTVGTLTSAGTTATGVDAERSADNSAGNGGTIVFTSGTNDGEIRTQASYVGSTTTWTTRGDVLPAATSDGDTVEYWAEDMPAQRVNRMIDDAVSTITRKGAPPSSDISLHGYRDRYTFDIPTALVGIQHLKYRSSFTNTRIHNCNTAWDEQGTVTDVTTTADDEDYAEGQKSNKHVILSGLSAAAIIASDDITSLDLSRYDTAEFWIKSTVALAAGELSVRLSSTASAGTATEELAVPATAADTWTFHRVTLANPETDTAIISVGLIYTTDIGAATIWVDDVRAVVDDSAQWIQVDRDWWGRDKDRRKLILKQNQIRYSLIKLEGYKKPTQLTTDATTCDVEPEYIIQRTAAWLMRSRGNRYNDRREADWLEAERLEGLAELWMTRQRLPQGVIWVDNP